MILTITQGDSYPVFCEIMQDGHILTPEMVEDLEISVGNIWSFSASCKTLAFDETSSQWYFWPTAEETSAAKGGYPVHLRVSYCNDPGEKYVFKLGHIVVDPSPFKEVR